MPTIKATTFDAGAGIGRAAGQPTIAETFRSMVDDMAVLHTAITTLTAALDSTLTLEGLLELVNEIRTKYEAHRIFTTTSTHENADSTNSIAAPPATDLATAMTLINDIKAKLNAHYIGPSQTDEVITLLNELKIDYNAHAVMVGGGEHTNAGTNLVVAADATNLTTAYVLANDLKTQYELHRVEVSELEEAIVSLNDIKVQYGIHHTTVVGTAHGAGTDGNNVTAPDATNEATAYTLANDIKTQYEAHRINVAAGVHANPDGTNVIAAPDATTLATLLALTVELRTDYEAHRVLTAGPVHGVAGDIINVVATPLVGAAAVHLDDDTTNAIGSADAATYDTLKALANELRTDYEAHRQDAVSHGAPDGTNTVAAVAVGIAGIHEQDDVINTIAVVDATDQATLNALSVELRTDFIAHMADTTSHPVVDITNTVNEPAALTNYAAGDPAVLATTKG